MSDKLPIVVVAGLAGSGKTTFASRFEERYVIDSSSLFIRHFVAAWNSLSFLVKVLAILRFRMRVLPRNISDDMFVERRNHTPQRRRKTYKTKAKFRPWITKVINELREERPHVVGELCLSAARVHGRGLIVGMRPQDFAFLEQLAHDPEVSLLFIHLNATMRAGIKDAQGPNETELDLAVYQFASDYRHLTLEIKNHGTQDEFERAIDQHLARVKRHLGLCCT